MTLLFLMGLAAASYATFAVLFARSGTEINGYDGTALYSAVAAAAAWLAGRYVQHVRGDALSGATTKGIFLSVGAGLCIALFSVLLVRIFSRGGLAYVMPLVYGGTVVLTVVAARFLFRETLTPLQALGTGLIVLGIGIVAYAKFSHAA